MRAVWRSQNKTYRLIAAYSLGALVVICFANLNLATLILGLANLFGAVFALALAANARAVEMAVNYHLTEYAGATNWFSIVNQPDPDLSSRVDINGKMFIVIETDPYGLIATVYKLQSEDLEEVWLVVETVFGKDRYSGYKKS